MKKIVVVGGGVLIVLLCVVLLGALVVSCQIETIVEEAIEREGSKIVGTPVKVGSVELSLFSGKGDLSDLAVANPQGFDTPHVLTVGGAAVHLDPWSVLDDDGPVDIHSLRLRDTTVTIEAYIMGLKTNVGAIKSTISSSRAEVDAAEPGEGGDVEASSGVSKRKLRIEQLRLESTRVQVVFHAPRRTVKRAVGLTDFELRDLGGSEGATPREIAQQIFTEVAVKARSAMFRMPGPWQKLRNKLLENLDEGRLDRLEEVGSKLLDLGKALKEGQSLRDIRDQWRQQRLGSADGGPSVDGGDADAPPKIRDQIEALRESIRQVREGRKRGKSFGGVRELPVDPR